MKSSQSFSAVCTVQGWKTKTKKNTLFVCLDWFQLLNFIWKIFYVFDLVAWTQSLM